MFKKSCKLSASHALSGKDAKTLKKNCIESFKALSDEELVKLLFPSSKTEVTQNNVADSRIRIFSVNNVPLFFDISGKWDLYPTMYALWRVPTLCKTFVCPSPASAYLLNNADLMLPGIMMAPETWLAKEKFSVMVYGNPVPFAVGETLVSLREAKQAKMKGKGLKVVHIVYDHLWAVGPKEVPEGFTPQQVLKVQKECVEDESDEEEEQEEEQEENGEGEKDAKENEKEEPKQDEQTEEQAVPETTTTTTTASTSEEANQEGEKENAEEGNEDAEDGEGEEGASKKKQRGKLKVKSTPVGTAPRVIEEGQLAAMEALVFYTFVAAGSKFKPKDFPMLIPDFYTKHMLPTRPEGTFIDWKTTSYKKIGGFFKAMEKKKICKVKDQHGRFELMRIATENQEWKDTLATLEETKEMVRDMFFSAGLEEGKTEKEKDAPETETKKSTPANSFSLVELYRPGPAWKDLFEDPKAWLDGETACTVLINYMKEHKLLIGDDEPEEEEFIVTGKKGKGKKKQKKPKVIMVELDAFLQKNLYHKKEEPPELEVVGVLKDRFLNSLISMHRIQHGNELIEKKGHVKQVQIMTEVRLGNKTVTRVLHLDQLGFDLQRSAAVLQKKCASSVTIPDPIGGGKNSAPQYEILAQGNKIKEISQYLMEELGLPKKYIEVWDKAAERKRKH